MDRSLSFGCTTASKILNAIADIPAWVVLRNGIPYILQYLTTSSFLPLWSQAWRQG